MQEEVLVPSEEVTQNALEPISKAIANMYAAHSKALSRLSDRDAKHGARVIMENLFFLQPHLLELSKLVPDLSVISKGLSSTLTRVQDQYVDQQLQHSRLWPLLLLAGKLRVLLKDVRPADVRFQVCITADHSVSRSKTASLQITMLVVARPSQSPEARSTFKPGNPGNPA
jgi:hypothetical protein